MNTFLGSVAKGIVTVIFSTIYAFFFQWAGSFFNHHFTYPQALVLAYIYLSLLSAQI